MNAKVRPTAEHKLKNIFFTQNSNCFPVQKTLHRTFQHIATVFHSPKLVAMSRIALYVSLVISYKPFRPQELQNSVNTVDFCNRK